MKQGADEIVDIVRRVASPMAQSLEQHLLTAYGPGWLDAVNANLARQGQQPSLNLGDIRFCLAVFAYDPATGGWAHPDLRAMAGELLDSLASAVDDQAIPAAELARAREIATAFRQVQRPGATSLPLDVREFVDRVEQVTFRKPPVGKRGYDEQDVDIFLDRLAKGALRGWLMSPSEVRGVAFGKPPVGKRGYDEQDVDEFLDWVEEALTAIGP